MFDQLVAYIIGEYSRARRIVEVGVGNRIDVAERIKVALPLTEVVVTDRDENWVRKHQTGKIQAVADDVMFPQLAVYHNAALIYSIHPPVEIIPSMTDLARRIGADLVLIPRSDEQEALLEEGWEKITREGRIVGWRRASLSGGPSK